MVEFRNDASFDRAEGAAESDGVRMDAGTSCDGASQKQGMCVRDSKKWGAAQVVAGLQIGSWTSW